MQPFKNILYVNATNVEQAATLARAVSLAEKNNAVLTVIDVVPIEVVQVDMALPQSCNYTGNHNCEIIH